MVNILCNFINKTPGMQLEFVKNVDQVVKIRKQGQHFLQNPDQPVFLLPQPGHNSPAGGRQFVIYIRHKRIRYTSGGHAGPYCKNFLTL
jgi:hypothetical protein